MSQAVRRTARLLVVCGFAIAFALMAGATSADVTVTDLGNDEFDVEGTFYGDDGDTFQLLASAVGSGGGAQILVFVIYDDVAAGEADTCEALESKVIDSLLAARDTDTVTVKVGAANAQTQERECLSATVVSGS